MRLGWGAALAAVTVLGLGVGGCKGGHDGETLQVNSSFGATSQMYVDGGYVGDVPANGSAKWDISTGNHTFTASTSSTGINGDVYAGGHVVLTLDGNGNLNVP